MGQYNNAANREAMNTEKFSLRWNDFQQNITTAFGTLKDEPDFSDVTLACEDGQQLEAHRIILAASSPFYQNLLKRNKHPHPLIYTRGVKSADLVALIDFIYCGEVQVLKENLENFMAMAEELKIKGLWREEKEEPIETRTNQNIHRERSEETNSETKTETKIDINIEEETLKEVKIHLDEYQAEAKIPEDGGLQEVKVNLPEYESDVKIEANDRDNLKEQIKSMIGQGQTMGVKQRNNMCKVCGKESSWSSIMNHIESKHMAGLTFPCTMCEKVCRTRKVLSNHTRLAHTMV